MMTERSFFHMFFFPPHIVSYTSITPTAARDEFCSALRDASARCWKKTSPWFCLKRLTSLLSSIGWPARPLQSATVVLKHFHHSYSLNVYITWVLKSVSSSIYHSFVLYTNLKSTCIFPFTDLLLDCLELCKSTRSAADVYRQCQIEDFGFLPKVRLLNFVCLCILHITHTWVLTAPQYIPWSCHHWKHLVDKCYLHLEWYSSHFAKNI